MITSVSAPKQSPRFKQSQSIKGFTLIEVVIVLAISSLFAIMLLAGYQTRQARGRFTDGMERTVSVLNQIKNRANTTENTHINGGTDSSRVILGQLIRFNGSNITSTELIGSPTNTFSSLTAGQSTTFIVPWGITFQSTGALYDGIAYVRSPVESENATLKSYPIPPGVGIGDVAFVNMLNDHNGAAATVTYNFLSPEDLEARIIFGKNGLSRLEYLN